VPPVLVVDAQPIVALVRGESVAARANARLFDALGRGSVVMSAVNWCEVMYLIRRHAGSRAAAGVAARLERMPIAVVDVDVSLAGFAAAVKSDHQLGMGDSFAAALAMMTELPLLTADADFLPLAEHGLKLDWLG